MCLAAAARVWTGWALVLALEVEGKPSPIATSSFGRLLPANSHISTRAMLCDHLDVIWQASWLMKVDTRCCLSGVHMFAMAKADATPIAPSSMKHQLVHSVTTVN